MPYFFDNGFAFGLKWQIAFQQNTYVWGYQCQHIFSNEWSFGLKGFLLEIYPYWEKDELKEWIACVWIAEDFNNGETYEWEQYAASSEVSVLAAKGWCEQKLLECLNS